VCKLGPYVRVAASGGLAALVRLTPVDIFAAVNVALFSLLAATVYWERFVAFRGRANLLEFLAYATFFLCAIGAAWFAGRKLLVRWTSLAAFEAGLLLHFAGGLLHPGGRRLYDHEIGLTVFDVALRFDKVVHLANAIAGCVLTLELLRVLGIRAGRATMLLVGLVVLGGGAVVEIVEYVVVKTIPHNGVGDYDNNMTDLAANLLGCILYALVRAIVLTRRRRRAS